MRYPLLAAIHRGNTIVAAWWSYRFDAPDHVNDAWMMLHWLAARIINGNEVLTRHHPLHHTTLMESQFSHRLTERLLALSTGVLNEGYAIPLRSRLRSCTTQSRIGEAEFKSMLVSILDLTRSDDAYVVQMHQLRNEWVTNMIDSFLDDRLMELDC